MVAPRRAEHGAIDGPPLNGLRLRRWLNVSAQRRAATMARHPPCSSVALALVAAATVLGLSRGCYKFPPGVLDPCKEKSCEWGAECRPTLDGRGADCVCPDKCVSYGDARGSRPVCGSDGRDYPNSCELRRAACNAMRDVEQRFTGPCGERTGCVCVDDARGRRGAAIRVAFRAECFERSVARERLLRDRL